MKYVFLRSLIGFFECSYSQVAGDFKIKKDSDCITYSVILGIFSPCSSDTVSSSILASDIVLTLKDTTYKMESFELTYALDDTSFFSKSFIGNKAIFSPDVDFWSKLKEAKTIFIDEIRVTRSGQRFKLPSIVKYVRKGL